MSDFNEFKAALNPLKINAFLFAKAARKTPITKIKSLDGEIFVELDIGCSPDKELITAIDGMEWSLQAAGIKASAANNRLTFTIASGQESKTLTALAQAQEIHFRKFSARTPDLSQI